MCPNLRQNAQPACGLVPNPALMDELVLWREFKSGNEKALAIIVDRFTKPLYRYGHKIFREDEMVKDGIQELFIEIWQNRERLSDTDSIKFYLFKSLRRKLVKLKARSEKFSFAPLSNDYNIEVSRSHEYTLIREQLSAEKKEKVRTLMNKLTKRQHEAVFLRYFEELDCDEIAASMELAKQTVYNLIHTALEQLKK